MGISQQRTRKKPSGGKLRSTTKKKQQELGRESTHTRIDETKVISLRVRGGGKKFRVLQTNNVNLFLKNEKKYVQAKIEKVIENPANRHFVRRNILTKGTIIKTDKGKAKIISRPGQEAVINAIQI
jgi:small subunit ribosomal protein S8e